MIHNHPDAAETQTASQDGWKAKALADFKAWLDDLPEKGIGLDATEIPDLPASGLKDSFITPSSDAVHVSMDSCDLYTLLMEFTALRQEIKLQNREQHAAIRMHADLIDGIREYADLFKERSKDLATLEERIRTESQTKTIEKFFDVRDALRRGHESVEEALEKGIYF